MLAGILRLAGPFPAIGLSRGKRYQQSAGLRPLRSAGGRRRPPLHSIYGGAIRREFRGLARKVKGFNHRGHRGTQRKSGESQRSIWLTHYTGWIKLEERFCGCLMSLTKQQAL